MLGRLISIFLVIFTTNVYADTLYLKNGRQIEGIIKSENDGVVEMEVYGGSIKMHNNDIDRIERLGEEDNEALRNKWGTQKTAFENKLRQYKIEEEHKPKEVEFSDENQSITVKALINEDVTTSLVLDTGASTIMLRRHVADKLGIKLDKPDAKVTLANGKTVDAKQVTLRSVKVQDSEAFNVGAVILMEEDNGLGAADGLLGMSFLKNFSFKIDQKYKKLILEKL